MLQVNFLRDNKERVLEGLKKRNFKQLELVDEAIHAIKEQLEEIYQAMMVQGIPAGSAAASRLYS